MEITTTTQFVTFLLLRVFSFCSTFNQRSLNFLLGKIPPSLKYEPFFRICLSVMDFRARMDRYFSIRIFLFERYSSQTDSFFLISTHGHLPVVIEITKTDHSNTFSCLFFTHMRLLWEMMACLNLCNFIHRIQW